MLTTDEVYEIATTIYLDSNPWLQAAIATFDEKEAAALGSTVEQCREQALHCALETAAADCGLLPWRFMLALIEKQGHNIQHLREQANQEAADALGGFRELKLSRPETTRLACPLRGSAGDRLLGGGVIAGEISGQRAKVILVGLLSVASCASPPDTSLSTLDNSQRACISRPAQVGRARVPLNRFAHAALGKSTLS